MHHAVIDSTNLEALRAWPPPPEAEVSSGGTPQPLLVSADAQTAGRGRTDRPWQSPVGGLWMSIAWPPARQPDHYIALPLAVGLAVAKAVGRICRIDCAIKWPNDLLVNDRKLGGILCRYDAPAPGSGGLAPLPGTHLPGVLIIGLGVNGNYPASALGDDLRHPATSLLDQTGRATDLTLLRNAVAGQLAATLKAYDEHGLSPMLDELRARLVWRDQLVACDLPDVSGDSGDSGGSMIVGRLMDIDAAGRLVLDDRGTTRLISVGDIRHLRHANEITPSSRNPVYVSECSICRS